MPRPERQSSPAANQGASSVEPDSSSHILPPRTLEHPRAIAAGYAVLLVRRDEKVTRQVYLSLHSATKALERARVAGREASMVLVELIPTTAAVLTVVGGDDG